MSPYILKVVSLFAFAVHTITALHISPKEEYPATEDSPIFENGLKDFKLLHNSETRENVKQAYENACECENGACVTDGGKTVCKCLPEYGLFALNKCKACNCGKDSNCTFERGWFQDIKTCICKKGYTEVKGICEGPCTPNPCHNGGTCVDISESFKCKCLPGYTGEKCETGIATKTSIKPSETTVSSTTKQILIKTTSLATSTKTSRETYPYSIKSTISTTSTTLTTKTGCECRYGCVTNEEGEAVCKCLPGYGLYTKNICKECRCGENVECFFDKYGRKKCHCPHDFIEFQGKCKECYCGQNSACYFDKYGSKICECEEGFIEMNGKCRDVCDIYPCIHGTCIKIPGKGAICECNKNYKGIFCDVEEQKITEVKRESVITIVLLGVVLSVFLLQFLVLAYMQCRSRK